MFYLISHPIWQNNWRLNAMKTPLWVLLLCEPAGCTTHIRKKAEMCGKSTKYTTSQPFLLLTSTQQTNSCALRNSNLKQQNTCLYKFQTEACQWRYRQNKQLKPSGGDTDRTRKQVKPSGGDINRTSNWSLPVEISTEQAIEACQWRYQQNKQLKPASGDINRTSNWSLPVEISREQAT